MKAVFKNARLVKQIVDGVKELLGDVNIQCTSEGLCIEGMDASHVSLCSIHLDRTGMLDYSCPIPHEIGVNLNNFSKILSAAAPTDRLELESTDDVLKIRIQNTVRVSEFALSLMVIDEERVGIPPDWDGHRRVRMPSMEFQRVIRDLSVVGDSCRIEIRDSAIAFTTDGTMGHAHIGLQASDTVEFETTDDADEIDLEFPIRYLHAFTKCGQTSKDILISAANDHPLRITYQDTNWGRVVFFLAPKITDL